MKREIVLCGMLAAALACAGASRRADTRYVCTEHGLHHFELQGEQCACLNITPGRYGEYDVFTMTGETKQADKVPGLLTRLRDDMEDKVVSMVLSRIERAMGKNILKHWQFENMDIPVTIRGFKKFQGGTHHVMIAAAMTKHSLSPHGIIMYLPLEYKMHLLEKKKDD